MTPDAKRPSWLMRWRYAFYAAGLLLLAWWLLMWLERSMIFFPSRYPSGEWNPSALTFEDAFFTAADGTRLHGWHAHRENPRAVILYCHGNAGNITHRAEILRILHGRVGASVLMFDYRGYGRSEGKPSEHGLLADARAARAWLAEREGIDPSDVVLMGRSLGGAVAVDLAAADGARGLVLESTFTSIPDMAAYHYPALPVRGLLRTRFDSLSKIANYHGPLLASHGDADTLVPMENGQKLFEAANQPKQFIRLGDRGHNEPLPMSYYDALGRFLDGLPKSP
ncbi:MAG: alpha/beta hydrolase [Pirellulales bacterium]|nr:alpha/beta hydrolase [Pirellulales bacterium]